MPNRRDFLRRAAALSGAGLFHDVPSAIQRALAIEPEKGSSYLDAEHVVILMQENRSFDHAFGSLQGVRGFNDPRAIRLPDGNPVWVQSNSAGEKYIPFRLDIKESKITWMGSLPHGWTDQVDAANGGKHDRWLHVKRSGHREYAKMPLTLGYHTREDIPFYYALADAFTISDQNFCSSLTGTTPNRLHLWTGTIREKPGAAALVRNEDCQYGAWVSWTTFPERLEDRGVSWKIYQNELTVPNGLTGETDAWLANFEDNPIEWFTQFGVRFAKCHQEYLDKQLKEIPIRIAELRKKMELEPNKPPLIEDQKKWLKEMKDLQNQYERFQKDRAEFSPEKFAKLSPRQKSLHARAFVTNTGDPAYRELAEFTYKYGETMRKLKIPKGDVLHQFRKDVQDATLPTVSWLVAPEQFSDHPSAAWYGSWYLSEVLEILTKNPKVWKKTIFILTYDENDGYFDHVPPFQAPHPKKPETGLVSKGLDTTDEYVELGQDRKHRPMGAVRGNSIGLGYRVPMIIASPWSRGGCVCSQVFDHTSVLRFLEKLLSHKTGQKLEETNISAWRRTVCGNLTSAFQSAADEKPGLRGFLARDPFIEGIHKAQYKKLPAGFHALSDQEIEQIREKPALSLLPRQEPGTRKSCPLPYELNVDGALNEKRDAFTMRFEAKKVRFGDHAAGSPFVTYAFTAKGVNVRHYAVAVGDRLEDSWPLELFENGDYHFRVHGPNGFFREFKGNVKDPKVQASLSETSEGYARINIRSDGIDERVEVIDRAYGFDKFSHSMRAGDSFEHTVKTPESRGWYDVSVTAAGFPHFEKRYAGRVETGRWSITDPAMG